MPPPRRLRSLADGKPAGVSDAVWQKYPPLDVTAATTLATVRIDTTPTGGEVWIDHRRVGTAPLTAHLTEGEHVIAAAAAGGSTADLKTFVTWGPHDVTLDVPAPTSGTLDEARRLISAWKSERRQPTSAEMEELLALLDTDRIILQWTDEQVTGWLRTNGRVDQVVRSSSVAAVAQQLETWTPPTAAPAAVPDPGTGDRDSKDGGQPWWVYAGIGGAVALGALAIILSDVSSDTQRIELEIDPP